MQPQSSDGDAAVDARAATIKLVFKKAMLSKLGHSASSATQPLNDEAEKATAETPKTAVKKSEKQAAPSAKPPQKARSAPSKVSPAKASPVAAAKTSSKAAPSKAAPSKAAAAAKKATPQKQKRSEPNRDASSITTDLGRSVMSSTAGLDLADAAGDALPMNRVKRMMRELVGDLKLGSDSVAALVAACHGFISYMTSQVFYSARVLPCRSVALFLTRTPPPRTTRQAAQASPQAQLCYDDLAALVQDREMFEFLDEVLPQRFTAEDAAAINFQLKLSQGVTINPVKKVCGGARVIYCVQ